MKQADKELLLKDLCARLPYGVKAKYYGSEEECECCDTIEGIYPMDDEVIIGQYGLSVGKIKPYLFPISSMTEEQSNELFTYFHDVELKEIETSGDYLKAAYLGENAKRDWLNKNHFDYHYLIPKGLAIDATVLNIY